MSATSAARRLAPRESPDPHDALGAALDDAIARLLPVVVAPPAHRVALRDALLALLAALDRHDPLPLAAVERALAPLEFTSAQLAPARDPAVAALRVLLDRARALAA